MVIMVKRKYNIIISQGGEGCKWRGSDERIGFLFDNGRNEMSEVAKQWWPSTLYEAPKTIEPLHIVWINKSGDTDPYVTVTKADTLQYSYDNANWVNASSANISGSQIDGSSEYHVYIRRRPDLAPTTALFSSVSLDNKWTINGGQARISGNIMSLLGQDEEVGNYAFAFLFNQNSNLIDASGLEMPATKLGAYCYSYMSPRGLHFLQ